ncbi:hypothetical protein SLA2020_276850 [Shorea laevis]
MAEPLLLGDGTRRKGMGRRATTAAEAEPVAGAAAAAAPCGACKFLRRKCISGCIFAPHFGSDQGAARFAAVHKVFGASNVSKLLLHVPSAGETMPWLQYRMKLRRGYQTQFMVAYPPYLLYRSRLDSFFLFSLVGKKFSLRAKQNHPVKQI